MAVTRTANIRGARVASRSRSRERHEFQAGRRSKKRMPIPATQLWPWATCCQSRCRTRSEAEKLSCREGRVSAGRRRTEAFVVTCKGPGHCRALRGRCYGADAARKKKNGCTWARDTATLLAFGQDGVYELDQPAPIPAWQSPATRAPKIRIADSFTCRAGSDQAAPKTQLMTQRGLTRITCTLYRRHRFLSTTRRPRPLQWPPNTVGRYHNTDPV